MITCNLSWSCYNDCIRSNLPYWQSATSKSTSMSLGTQKGFVANPVNAPNNKIRKSRRWKFLLWFSWNGIENYILKSLSPPFINFRRCP